MYWVADWVFWVPEVFLAWGECAEPIIDDKFASNNKLDKISREKFFSLCHNDRVILPNPWINIVEYYALLCINSIVFLCLFVAISH